MKGTKYTRVNWTDAGVFLSSTDSDVMDWAFAEVQKYIPTAALFRDWRGVLLSGETYAYTMHKLEGRDRDVAWWIVKELCLQGWETFAVEGSTIHLRLKG
jgi:hypothetical protein